MKTFFLTTITIACFFSLAATGQVNYKQLYENKVKSYTRMTNTGTTLATIGAVGIGGGAVLLFTIPEENEDYSNDGAIVSHVLGGVLCIAAGIDLLTAGLIVGSIGSHKRREYKNKLNNLSMSVIYNPKQKGLMLTYRF